MSDIVRYPAGGTVVSSRRARSSLNQVEVRKQLGISAIEATAEIQGVKADAISYVGQRAMHNVAMVSQLETQLAQAVPHASGRLDLIATTTALALADVVQQSVYRVNRTC